jgi:hypothetical protein
MKKQLLTIACLLVSMNAISQMQANKGISEGYISLKYRNDAEVTTNRLIKTTDGYKQRLGEINNGLVSNLIEEESGRSEEFDESSSQIINDTVNFIMEEFTKFEQIEEELEYAKQALLESLGNLKDANKALAEELGTTLIENRNEFKAVDDATFNQVLSSINDHKPARALSILNSSVYPEEHDEN